MADVDELAGIALFEPLSEPELRELAGWFEARTIGEGVRLIGEGTPGYSFFVLTAGSAVVTSSDGATLAELGPGDFFGEMAILGDGRRVASVTTTSDSKLLVMFGTEFRQLQQEQPRIGAEIEAAMRHCLAARG